MLSVSSPCLLSLLIKSVFSPCLPSLFSLPAQGLLAQRARSAFAAFATGRRRLPQRIKSQGLNFPSLHGGAFKHYVFVSFHVHTLVRSFLIFLLHFDRKSAFFFHTFPTLLSPLMLISDQQFKNNNNEHS